MTFDRIWKMYDKSIILVLFSEVSMDCAYSVSRTRQCLDDAVARVESTQRTHGDD